MPKNELFIVVSDKFLLTYSLNPLIDYNRLFASSNYK